MKAKANKPMVNPLTIAIFLLGMFISVKTTRKTEIAKANKCKQIINVIIFPSPFQLFSLPQMDSFLNTDAECPKSYPFRVKPAFPLLINY